MVTRFSLPFTALLLIAPLAAAATSANLDQEYQQVRKIALRDPKVRAAYDEADRKLEAKISQIDPALAGYVPRHAAEPGSAPEVKKATTQPKPASVPEGTGATHVVTKGETLSAIAAHYGVTVTALKTTNHIADEKKLAVGQTLNIPPR
jgi:LysM repeat protein